MHWKIYVAIDLKKTGDSYQEVVAQSMFCYMHKKKHTHFLMSIDSLKKTKNPSQVLRPNDAIFALQHLVNSSIFKTSDLRVKAKIYLPSVKLT